MERKCHRVVCCGECILMITKEITQPPLCPELIADDRPRIHDKSRWLNSEKFPLGAVTRLNLQEDVMKYRLPKCLNRKCFRCMHDA